jgi:hypothetical protein
MSANQPSSPPEQNSGPTLIPRAARAPLVHAVMCQFAGEPDFIEVTTLNVSQSGMLVRSAVVPAIGTAIKFKFLLETGFEILSGAGTVMRHAYEPSGNPGIGIAFAELAPSKQRILARVIELHSEPVVYDDAD